jgi:phosphatidylserine/phosphatidylglycerophosphate/cardiolipin synthase-like enzyme
MTQSEAGAHAVERLATLTRKRRDVRRPVVECGRVGTEGERMAGSNRPPAAFAVQADRYRGRLAMKLSTAILILSASISGCAPYPPPDGVQGAGPGGLEEIAQGFGVTPLDPNSKTPLVNQALVEVEKTDPLRLYRGTTYGLTLDNRLPAHWLLQTPNIWGRRGAAIPFFPTDCQGCNADFRLPACSVDSDCGAGRCVSLRASVSHADRPPEKLCVGHSDRVLDTFYDLVVSAEQAVDITLLQPPADIRFQAALRNAITYLAYSGRKVTVRVLVGDYPPDGTDARDFLQQLMRDAMGAPASRMHVYVAVTRSCNGDTKCSGLSWNHAKIVAVDGRRAIVGGHNMWTGDYLVDAPIHDLSMEVDGPAALSAHRFADALWRSVCARPRIERITGYYDAVPGRAIPGDGCLPQIELPENRGATGAIPILAIGRLGAGMAPVFADQSLVARNLLLGAATRTIRLLQQDVAFAVGEGEARSWPESAFIKLADLMAVKGGNVFLVLSDYGAVGSTETYSNLVPLKAVAEKIRDVVRRRTNLREPELSAMLCERLHLAPLRFGPDASWPNNRPIGTHAKMWMIDERAFYIGSENLYPVELQEFGYVVEDAGAAAELRRSYWDQIWRWSRLAAISGADAPSCVFTAPTVAQASEN